MSGGKISGDSGNIYSNSATTGLHLDVSVTCRSLPVYILNNRQSRDKPQLPSCRYTPCARDGTFPDSKMVFLDRTVDDTSDGRRSADNIG